MKIPGKCSTLAFCAGLFGSLVSGIAFAQDTEGAAVEEIVVTGSRIKQSDLTSPSPLQVIDSQFIEEIGVINVQDAIDMNPAVGESESRVTGNGNITEAGVATVNLRNLGTDRTLVLVDGQRMVAGVPGTAQVDLTMIPTEFIERVEVLTGGASAVYGSDAIAGVVNFIYKKDFEGVVINAQTGVTSEGDGEESRLSLTGGSNFADGRGNFLFNVAYSEQEGVDNGARSFSDDSYFSVGVATGSSDPADLFKVTTNRSFVQPRGNIGVVGTNASSWVFSDDGQSVIPYDGSSQDIPHKFDPREFGGAQDNLAAPVDRVTAAFRASFDVNDKLTTTVDVNYGRVSSSGSNTFHPYVATFGFGIGISQLQEIESRLVNPADGTVSIVRNPFIPDSIYNIAEDTTGDGLRDVSYAKRVVEFGNRRTDLERQMFRVAFGASGDFNDNWSYDAHASFGRSDLDGKQRGLYITPNLYQSLRAVSDIHDFDGDGDVTEAICVDPQARLNGCVPIEFYGVNNVSEAAREYVQGGDGAAFQTSIQEMDVLAAHVSGTLFELPGGPLQAVFGLEHREETASHEFDPLYNWKQNGFVQEKDIAGEIKVDEIYTELYVPIVESLSARLAYRYSDYSTLGGFAAYNGGLEWAPTDSLRFRAVYARATRAPNVGESFRPAAAGVTSVVDPCNGVSTGDTDTTAMQCLADPGVLANANANGGTVVFIQTDFQGVGTLNTVNPDIAEEEATTYTFGVVWQPEFLPGLSATLDYYDIEIDDAISSVSTQFVLDQCYDAGNNDFCSLVDRRPQAVGPSSAGSLELITSGLVNSGGSFAEGIDLTAGYDMALGAGDLSLDFSYTHLIDQGVIPQVGADVNNVGGEVGFPENKWLLRATYQNGPWTIASTNKYIGEVFLDDGFLRSRFGPDTNVKSSQFALDPELYMDLQVKYRLQDTYDIYLGIRNLLDVQPPSQLIGGIPGDRNANYDIFGQFYYFGVRAGF